MAIFDKSGEIREKFRSENAFAFSSNAKGDDEKVLRLAECAANLSE